MTKRILIIDDQKTNLFILQKQLEFNLEGKFLVYEANNIAEAKEVLESNSINFVLIDLHIGYEAGEQSGIELAKYIDDKYPNLKYCYISTTDKNNIVGAKIEANLGKIFDKEFFERLKNELYQR